jgi:hypothetical protein
LPIGRRNGSRNWSTSTPHTPRTEEIDTGHDIMITEPEKLSQMLLHLG